MAPLKPALLIVFVVVAVISGESATYSYYHSTTGACARVPGLGRGGEEGGGERDAAIYENKKFSFSFYSSL